MENKVTMEINFKKRHIAILLAGIFALFLIIPNCQMIQKILNAKDISALNGMYHYGEYVQVDFDNILYIEYDGLSGEAQKRYAVCSTLEGDIFYVNGTPDKYVLVEITNAKTIEEIESSANKHYQTIGIIEQNIYDVKEFLEKNNSDIKLENSIVVKEVEYRDVYIAKIFHGCFILLFCIILFYCWGGVHSIVRRDKSETL